MAATEIKAGTRLRCESCSSEIIVIKPAEAVLECCGKPLAPLTPGSSAGAQPS